MNRIIPALILSLGLVGFSSTGIAGEGCIYGSKFKATSTDTEAATDETPATVIIVPEEQTEQDPS